MQSLKTMPWKSNINTGHLHGALTPCPAPTAQRHTMVLTKEAPGAWAFRHEIINLLIQSLYLL